MSALPDLPTHSMRPLLSTASARFTHGTSVVDEYGRERDVQMPAERDLTLYLDKRELVTLMTMAVLGSKGRPFGASPGPDLSRKLRSAKMPA